MRHSPAKTVDAGSQGGVGRLCLHALLLLGGLLWQRRGSSGSRGRKQGCTASSKLFQVIQVAVDGWQGWHRLYSCGLPMLLWPRLMRQGKTVFGSRHVFVELCCHLAMTLHCMSPYSLGGHGLCKPQLPVLLESSANGYQLPLRQQHSQALP